MEILGLLTIALVAGTLARAAYRDTVPADIAPSFIAGFAGVGLGHATATLTGIGAMSSIGDLATWVTALTCAYLAVAIADAVRAITPLRGVGRLS